MDKKEEQGTIPRRTFLKAALVAGGAILTGCKLSDSDPLAESTPGALGGKSPTPTGESEREAIDPDSDLVDFGELGGNIWQVRLGSGQGLVQAVESIAPWNTWSDFAMTWFSGDRSRAVYFIGSRGIPVWDGLMREQSNYGLENLARYDPRTAAPNDTVVFGETSVVGRNFSQILGSEKLSSLKEYLEVSYRWHGDTQSGELNAREVRRLLPGDPDYSPGLDEWQSTSVAGFTRTGHDGPWTRKQ